MMTTGVTVDLPKSNASPIAGQDEPLAVSVTAGGKIFVQKTEVPINALAEKLKAITGEKKDTRIFVRGDRNVDYGKVMEVVSAINTAGYGKVALITDVGANNNGKDK
jgi:biopolymer transport protein TolR